MYGTYASERDYGAVRAADEPSLFRYEVQAGDTLASIAEKLNTTERRLLKLNPLLASSSKKHRVKVYAGQQLVVEKAASVSLPLPPGCIDNGWGQMHVVRAGETLRDIAAQYNTTEAFLRQDNRKYFPSGERGTMFAGMMLHVRYVNIGQLEPEEEVPVAKTPSSSKDSSPVSTSQVPTTISKYKSHCITKKDTFESLCKQYNIDYQRLLHINRGRFPLGARAELVVGELLIVPDLEASKAEERRRNVGEIKLTKQIHIVEDGETPHGIAERYRMSYEDLREWNRAYFPKGYRGEIRAGNKLVVKRLEEEERDTYRQQREHDNNHKHSKHDDSDDDDDDDDEEDESESDGEDRHGYNTLA